MKTCAVLGHRKIKKTIELESRVRKAVETLIVVYGVKRFLFGSKSEFNDFCYDIVSKLKEKYFDIKRVYVRAEYPIIHREYEEYLERFYEESYYYDTSLCEHKLAYIKRNEKMINESEFCLFYYDFCYIAPINKNSGTKLAYNYAEKKGKTIINVF